MDLFLVEIVELMHEAERTFVSGHDKKLCVLHGAQELLRSNGMIVDTAVLDAFIDVVCMMSRNKALLEPLARKYCCSTCFLKCLNNKKRKIK